MMGSAEFSTDHAFQSDGASPYCSSCELLAWMHSDLDGA
jgi:hypothetical protein